MIKAFVIIKRGMIKFKLIQKIMMLWILIHMIESSELWINGRDHISWEAHNLLTLIFKEHNAVFFLMSQIMAKQEFFVLCMTDIYLITASVTYQICRQLILKFNLKGSNWVSPVASIRSFNKFHTMSHFKLNYSRIKMRMFSWIISIISISYLQTMRKNVDRRNLKFKRVSAFYRMSFE